MESYLNQADSGYGDHSPFTQHHICEHLDSMPTTWLAASGSYSSYWYLLRGSDTRPGSSDLHERGQLATSAQSRIPFSGSPPDSPTPRMEALIRQEYPVTTQKELRTPYQQQVQAPVLSTHSTGIGRGAILEMMQRKSQELEHQAATVGHG